MVENTANVAGRTAAQEKGRTVAHHRTCDHIQCRVCMQCGQQSGTPSLVVNPKISSRIKLLIGSESGLGSCGQIDAPEFPVNAPPEKHRRVKQEIGLPEIRSPAASLRSEEIQRAEEAGIRPGVEVNAK